MPRYSVRGPLPENKGRVRANSPARISGLQAFYNFEIPAPASQQPDDSGNGRALAYQVNTTNAAQTVAVVGNGVRFTSSPNGLRNLGSKYFTNSWGPDVSSSFSLSVWLKPRSFDSFQHIIGAPFNNGLYIGANNTNLTFNLFNGTAFGVVAPTIVADTWHHYVFIRDTNTLRLYADNSLVGTTANVAGQSFPNASSFGVGGSMPNDEYYFDGDVDALGVWSRALDASEVAFLWALGRGTQIP